MILNWIGNRRFQGYFKVEFKLYSKYMHIKGLQPSVVYVILDVLNC